jgi:LacI family transcriptional regulator
MIIEKIDFNNSELLYSQIANIIEKKIVNKEIPVGKKIPPERDLCKMLNVTAPTVGKALTRLVEEGYIVRRPSLGTFVISTEPKKGVDLKRKNEIAIVVCPEKNIDMPDKNPIKGTILRKYNQSIIEGIEKKARDNRLYSIYSTIEGNELQVTNKREDIAGLIVLGGITPNDFRIIKKSRMPFVLMGDVDQEEMTTGADIIVNDDYGSTYLATKHLIELGHKRVLYINRYLGKSSWEKKQLDGYENVLKEAGIPCDKDLEMEVGMRDADGRYSAIKDILEKGKPFTALVSVGDISGLAAVKAIKEKNMRIPEDMSVVVVGESSEITSVSYDLTDLGKKAVERLLERLTNPADWKPERVLVPSRLHVHNTTAQPRNY